MILFIQTFRNNLRIKNILILSVIFSIISVILGLTIKNAILQNESFDLLTSSNMIITIFFIQSFIWSTGIPFLITITNRGVNMILKEVDEGTMILLVSKPFHRYRIILEKFLGNFISTIFLSVWLTSLNILLLFIISGFDTYILNKLITAIPGVIIYSVLISFIFYSTSLLLSLLLKKRTLSLILSISFFMIMFLIIPLFRSILSGLGYYDKYSLYYYDINYHFGIMYAELFSHFLPHNIPTIMTIPLGSFLGIYNVSSIESIMDPEIGMLLSDIPFIQYMNVLYIFILWICITIVSLITSIIILNKRDFT